MRIGFVVNPVAGMGGRVGLKGTDGKVAAARERGAEPRAPDRAAAALESLADHADDLELLVAGGIMGAEAAEAAGIEATVVADAPDDPFATAAADTRRAVRAFLEHDVDLVLFAGGDGTAVDVAEAISAADGDVPMLGVPAGVKIYSSVFGVTPRDAGRIAATFDRTAEREVNDIDEAAYREGEVMAELRAVVSVPVADRVQAGKQLAGGSVGALAEGVAADVREGVTYVFGPGGTVGAVEEELGIDPSPLGVDVYRDGEVVAADAAESEILDALGEDNVIVVSPIGGQGFLFGRGNDQLSPAVIRRCDLEVVASRHKLDDVGVLRVDTGDPELDEALRGWEQVRTGRYERRLLKVV